MSRDHLGVDEALRIVTAVVMVATGTDETDIVQDLRPSALSLDVVQRALFKIRDACNRSTDIVEISMPGAPCMHGFAPGACVYCAEIAATIIKQ